MKRAAWLFPLAVVPALMGCASPLSEKDIVGTWNGEVDVKQVMATAKVPPAAAALLGAQDKIPISISFDEAKTFSYSMKLGPMDVPLTGVWELKDGTVVMTHRTLMNQPVEKSPGGADMAKPLAMKVGEDRKTMVPQQTEGFAAVTLKKS